VQITLDYFILPRKMNAYSFSNCTLPNTPPHKDKAWYEWGHHAPLLLSTPGIEQDCLDTVLNAPPHSQQVEGHDTVLDEQHSAVMAYTDAMTLDVSVPDAVFARLKNFFNEKEVVEITATVAAYNCVSRFLVALDVGEKNGKGMEEK
jgi:alkylhydroperoxidase family enzyme